MTAVTDQRARMRREVWTELVRSAAERGDPYAQLLAMPEDPNPVYVRVRERGPVHRSTLGTWVTASHPLASRILRDRRFGVRQVSGEKAAESMNFDNSMLGLDPPDHTRLRKLAAPTLNPRRMERWRPTIERYCDELVDRILLGGERFNFMTAFAQQLPVQVMSDLIGIPQRHRRTSFRLTRRMAHLVDGSAAMEVADDVGRAVAEMSALFADVIAERRAEPADDLISDLLPAVDDGRLSMDELIPMCTFLSLAGVETTVNLIGNATITLLRHPEQWELFRSNTDLAPGVIQETLRYETPVQQYRRIVQEELELGGHRLPVDSELAICAGGANRDPEVYADPDTFDITRSGGSEVLSFSLGAHFCLGATLARLEAEVALSTIARRLPGLRQIGPVRRRDSYIIRGMLQFPVAVS